MVISCHIHDLDMIWGPTGLVKSHMNYWYYGLVQLKLQQLRLAVFTYFTLLENPDAIYLLMAMPSLMFLFLTFQGCSKVTGTVWHSWQINCGGIFVGL